MTYWTGKKVSNLKMFDKKLAGQKQILAFLVGHISPENQTEQRFRFKTTKDIRLSGLYI